MTKIVRNLKTITSFNKLFAKIGDISIFRTISLSSELQKILLNNQFQAYKWFHCPIIIGKLWIW